MTYKLSRQRLLGRVAHAIAGLAVFFLGLAIATAGVHIPPIQLDQSPVLGALIVVAGAAYAASQAWPLLRAKRSKSSRQH